MSPSRIAALLLFAAGCKAPAVPTATHDMTGAPPDLATPSDLAHAHPGDMATAPGSCAPFGGTCCDASGNPVGEVDCVGGKPTCTTGSFCRCGDDLETFSCTDFCGSDEFLSPSCVAGKWQCPGEVPVHTDQCPPGTCWGLPAECCDAAGHYINIECHDGAWSCPGKWCYLFDDGGTSTPPPARRRPTLRLQTTR